MAEIAIACFEIDAYTEHEDSIYTRPDRQANIFLTKRPGDILVVSPIIFIAKKTINFSYQKWNIIPQSNLFKIL